MTRSEPGGGLRRDSRSPGEGLGPWGTAVRTSGGSQSDGIKPEAWRLQPRPKTPVWAPVRRRVLWGWQPPRAGANRPKTWGAKPQQLSREPPLCKKKRTNHFTFHPATGDSHILLTYPRLPWRLQPRSWTSRGACRLCCGSSEPRPPPYRATKACGGGPCTRRSTEIRGRVRRWSAFCSENWRSLGNAALKGASEAEGEDARQVIIPLLHTLMYVLTKATGIPEELYQRTYTLCMRLLTLPSPYCTIALDCAIRLKTERAVPGTLYQRLVIAEQNLRSESYPYQERVLLFVDPELVSPSVCSALLLEIEAAQIQQTPEACMRHVVSHTLQAALGEACRAEALQRKLKAIPRRALERYFHAVVAAVEHMASEPSSSRVGHQERLEEIYCSLMGPTAAARGRCGGDPLPDRPPNIPLPSPHITFHLWTDEEQLWKELVLFLRPRSLLRLSADLEALDLQGLLPDRALARESVLSTDSGIERDLPLGATEPPTTGSPEVEHAGLQRKGGIKKRVWPPDILMPSSWDGPPGLHRRTGRPSGDGELLPGVSRLHTARVLVLGDDRMLGRLARAYHSLRKRETQMFCLTPRMSLQLYYIPVLTPETLASSRRSELGELATFLGRADPWYESTINTLCPAIHKLAEMPPSLDTSRNVDPFILDVITYYVRMGTQPIYFQIYTVKIFFSDLSQDSAEDTFLTELKVKIQDSKFPKDGSSPRRRGVVESPGAELSLGYQKALLSHRTREVTISLRATGLVLKALPARDTDDHTCLNVSVMEVVKSSNLAGRSFSTVTNTFRAANIQIQSQDQRLLTLVLDKDNRRTFRDVVRFEVAPCPEPCSGAQKSKGLWLSSHQQEMERTRAKPKPLLMPINTFSSIVQ